LESGNICLLGASYTGCETLKNLILPGIGSYMIVDDQIVSESDAGSNFFLTMQDIGSNRAEKCSQYLNELNADVTGSFLNQSPRELIHKNNNFFKQFTVIIATEYNEPDLIILGDLCRRHNVPLIIVLSYGMIGYSRVDFAEHTIIESHEEGILDLRLDNPWKELSDFANQFDFGNTTSQFRSHLPFPIILLEAVKRWKAQGHSFPPQPKVRAQFVSLVKSITGILDDDENSREAVAYCYKLYSDDKVH
jgi:amyloid beta precursor protein binding protein 1